MSQTTLLRTISAVDDIRVGLNNGTLTRLLSIGTTWNYLRVGIRASFETSVYNNVLGKTVFLGVCSGTSNGWNNGATTTTHAVGVVGPSTPYLGSYPISYTNGGIQGIGFYAPKGAKRVGTTVTESSTAAGTFYFNAHSDYRSQMWFVDIEKKTSPTAWNIKSWGSSDPNVAHTTKTTFINYMTTPYASLSLTGYTGGSTSPLTVDEATDGYLNAVNVFSEITSGNFEISDIAVARFS